jgi:hypothetical protein
VYAKDTTSEKVMQLNLLGHSSEVLLTGLPPAVSAEHTYSNPCNTSYKVTIK